VRVLNLRTLSLCSCPLLLNLLFLLFLLLLLLLFFLLLIIAGIFIAVRV
jgi:hypothetical protein